MLSHTARHLSDDVLNRYLPEGSSSPQFTQTLTAGFGIRLHGRRLGRDMLMDEQQQLMNQDLLLLAEKSRRAGNT